MLTREENDLLCRVEGDAPMGGIMRRHWLPAALSEELTERDGTPLRIRVLGEDLVAFRDSEGRLGIIGENCPHRGASLALGRNEDCGLRCLYHGWKVGVDGTILEMASEPAGSGFIEKVRHKAYPVREAGGFVWTYMGPPETMPDFAPPPFAPTPQTMVSVVKIHVACNWAQILEGSIDSAHSSSLHATDMVPARVDGAKATDSNWLRPSTDKAPRLIVQPTSFGFRYAAIRRPISNAATHDYLRTTLFVAPITVLIPPNNRYNVTTLHVPIDDVNTMFHFIAWSEDGAGIDQEAWRKFNHAQPGIDLEMDWRSTRTRANNYRQDRQAMKLGSHTGIPGIPNQDVAMWETLGPIVDRRRDRLGASDLAIVEFRHMMVEAAKSFAAGGAALGTVEPRIPLAKLRAFEGVIAKGTDWRSLGAAEEELARPQTTAAE